MNNASDLSMQKSIRQLPVGLCDKLTNAASVVTVPRLKSLLDKVACEFEFISLRQPVQGFLC